MKLGLLTAALPELAARARWPTGRPATASRCSRSPAGRRRAATTRRYAGVCHIDVDASTRDGVRRRRPARAHGLEISSLGLLPEQPLHPDPTHAREEANAHLRKVIDAAAALGVGVVGTFVGNDKDRPLPENLARVPRASGRRSSRYAERARREDRDRELPDDLLAATSGRAATTSPTRPRSGDEMFEAIPDGSFGLNLDPSHLVWQMIDYERASTTSAPRSSTCTPRTWRSDRDGLYRHGTLSLGIGWQVPRLPGLGEVRWDRFIAALYAVGYDFVVSIEHEDRSFEGDEELVKRGFLLSRNVLRPLLV